MKLNDALVDVLSRMGIRYVFGVSGANIEHLHDAIYRAKDSPIRSVLAKSESGAAYMADAHARVHRSLAVCCATSGGGMVNLLGGIAESYAESVPVLAIIGQPPQLLEGKGAFQESSGLDHSIDAKMLWKSVSKYVAKITKANEFWPALESALLSCLSARKGPSVLLIPRDVYDLEVGDCPKDFVPKILAKAKAKKVEPSQVAEIMKAISRAKSPVMVIGRGIRFSENENAIIDFLQRTNMPFAATISAGGEIVSSAQYLGLIGVAGHPSAHDFLRDRADLLLFVGTGLGLMTKGPLENLLKEKASVFINVDTAQIQTRYPHALVLEADAGEAFLTMSQVGAEMRVRFPDMKGYEREYFKPIIVSPSPSLEKAQSKLLQSEAIAALQEILPPSGHIVFDAGNCAAAALHYLSPRDGVSTTIALGMGSMGYALGGAVGAQLGSKEEARTIAIVGDGAFLMNGLEVHTAIELQLPILFVIFNNGKHGMCVTRQQLFFENRVECSTYSAVDISQVARGLGGPERFFVARAQSKESLVQALNNYKQNTKIPGLIELCLDIEEMPPFTPFLPKDAIRTRGL